MWASVMPRVDFHQFQKENVSIILKEWGDIVRKVDPKHVIIADNIHSSVVMDCFYTRPQDDWNVSENVDRFGVSFYPKNSRTDVMKNHKRWEVFDGTGAAAKNKGFWISEMQTHNRHMFDPGAGVHPYELRMWNWEGISHGASAIIYWMWEPFIKGVQTSARGLVDVNGNDTPRSDEAKDIGRIIAENEMEFLQYKPESPNVAILYDKLSQDFYKVYTLMYKAAVSESMYTDSIEGLYKCLWEQNIPTIRLI